MEFKIIREVKREILQNVFTTAIEGGSNYWYFLSDETIVNVRKVVPFEQTPYLSEAVFQAVIDHNLELPINDVHDEDEVLGMISRSTIQRRLQALADSESYGWALQNEMNEIGDADSSDVVFQFLAMGECMYA